VTIQNFDLLDHHLDLVLALRTKLEDAVEELLQASREVHRLCAEKADLQAKLKDAKEDAAALRDVAEVLEFSGQNQAIPLKVQALIDERDEFRETVQELTAALARRIKEVVVLDEADIEIEAIGPGK
jgi:uncharacterized coiled-coil DUF342 family protein